VVKSQPTDIVDIVLQLIRRPNGAHRACHSRKSRGELWFVLYLVADSRQIIWRESLRSLCKHSARAPTVLPHNVAWPFLPFLPWCGRHVSAAMICGRKRPLTLNLASMLRKMVLPDNVALQIFPQIFLGLTRKSVAKKSLGGLAIFCVRNGMCTRGKP